MARVLLVEAPHGAEPALPLALAQLAAVLVQAGHEVVGIDLAFDALPDGPFDWAVLHALPPWLDTLAPIVLALTARGTRTALIGVATTLAPAGALRRTGADVAIAGDPEHATRDLVAGEQPHDLAGVHQTTRAATPTRTAVVPLHTLPRIDRQVFPSARYAHAMRGSRLPATATFWSRGCARACPPCPMPARHPGGRTARTPEQVADEVGELVSAHGVRSLWVEDDALLADRAHALAVAAALRPWRGQLGWELVNGVRPEDVDGELLEALAAGGCVRVVFGFEVLHRGPGAAECDPAHARQLVRTAQRLGLRVGGYFTVGQPGRSVRESVQCLRHALSLGLDDANFTPFVPLPGSPWADEAPASRLHHALAVASTAAFLAQPRASRRLLVDVLRDPRLLTALRAKAGELGAGGGPYPLRPQP